MKLPWMLLTLTFVFTCISSYVMLHVVTFSGEMVDVSGNVPMDQFAGCKLYDVDDGEICFGENGIEKYSLRSWRGEICMIAQDSPMMAGTIRENICYGREDTVSEEKLMNAARISHVYDFVKDLPDGFDTAVSAGGGNFSGGQKQCIAIARAILSDKPYILLDEATSNLDGRREREVMEAIRALAIERTVIIIAHSISAIKMSDYVIVLNNGVLEERAPSMILEKTDNYLTKLADRRKAIQGK